MLNNNVSIDVFEDFSVWIGNTRVVGQSGVSNKNHSRYTTTTRNILDSIPRNLIEDYLQEEVLPHKPIISNRYYFYKSEESK